MSTHPTLGGADAVDAPRATPAAGRRPVLPRLGRAVAAAAVVGVVLPMGVGSAHAAAPLAASSRSSASLAAAGDKGKPGFVGFASSAWATPLEFEIYEPTIPIPATPQAELEVGYTKVEADSSSSQARSSYLWPGDPIGEGFKTVVENLGLPPQLADPLAANGYPEQVNAADPAGPAQDSQEPGPGMIQRASAAKGSALAENGFSGDGQTSDDNGDGSGSGGSGGSGGGSPIPGLPLPPLPPPLGTGGLTGTLTGLVAPHAAPAASGKTASAPAASTPAAPSLPPELSALVDVGGMTTVSRTDNDASKSSATSSSRAVLSDISLLGGLVTIDGVKTTASASSDGAKGVPTGQASFGKIVAFGQTFRVGPDGIEAVGQGAPIPGLPDSAAAALKQLGLKIILPSPSLTKDGDQAAAGVQGIIVDFDLTTLKKKLSVLPIGQLVNSIPDQAGQLKSLLQAAANLSPRIVVTLGNANAAVDTSQAIAIPPVPTTTPTTAPTATPGSGPATTSGTGPGSTGTSPGSSTPPGGTTPGGAAPSTAAALPPSAPVAAGLPALFSLSGALLFGGILLAGAIGWGARTLGLAALGGGSSCPHGLDSGLPDLRKVQ